jgi:hypothetical protein
MTEVLIGANQANLLAQVLRQLPRNATSVVDQALKDFITRFNAF